MAGTIASLALSTQFDKDGNLLDGGKLYFYQANSLTPQNVFADTGLASALANPIILDASGRVPEFYCADGNIRARLTDADGVVQFDATNLLVIGPSSGGGGGGGSVDPTTIYATGDTMFQDVAGTRTGWVRDNGRTIGSASSGSSERANADCQPLFEYLWNTYSDSICPVVGGRGGSSTTDWAANKQITLIDKRGVGAVGLDDMGNAAAGRFTGVPFASGNATTPGSICGENAHTLTLAEAPTGQFTHTFNDPTHQHTYPTGFSPSNSTAAGGNPPGGTQTPGTTSAVSTGITSTITDHAGGGAHNNVGRSITGTWYRKL